MKKLKHLEKPEQAAIAAESRENKPIEEDEERMTRRVEVRIPGVKLAGGAGARNRKSRKNLKLSLRGSVEKQSQHGLDQLNKPRVESDEDRSARPEPDPRARSMGSRKAVRGLRS